MDSTGSHHSCVRSFSPVFVKNTVFKYVVSFCDAYWDKMFTAWIIKAGNVWQHKHGLHLRIIF